MFTEGQLTCMACSTEETVASRPEWQAAPADAASSSASDINKSEALRPLMLMLSVLGRRCAACLGPLTLTVPCIVDTDTIYILCAGMVAGLTCSLKASSRLYGQRDTVFQDVAKAHLLDGAAFQVVHNMQIRHKMQFRHSSDSPMHAVYCQTCSQTLVHMSTAMANYLWESTQQLLL